MAYTQLGGKFTLAVSEAKFVSTGLFAAEPISCQVTSVQEYGSATIVNVTATTAFDPGQGVGLFQLGQENGIWKINGEEVPSVNLALFCEDIVNGREDTYFQIFSPDLRSQMSLNEFRQMLIDPSWDYCNVKITSWTGTRSSFIVQTANTSSGRTGHFSGTLVFANFNWEFRAFSSC